uniref:Hexosyltransferase n=1 Tax=Romanomermis culicivorax TaxID=13658 RepID=A0A915JEF8_ROMCU
MRVLNVLLVLPHFESKRRILQNLVEMPTGSLAKPAVGPSIHHPVAQIKEGGELQTQEILLSSNRLDPELSHEIFTKESCYIGEIRSALKQITLRLIWYKNNQRRPTTFLDSWNMNQTRMFPHHHRYPFQIQKLWRWQTTFCLVCLVTITLIFFNNRSTLIIPSSFEKINIVENVAQEIEFVKRKLDQINKDEFGHCFKKSADLNFTYEWTLMPSSCRLDIDAVLLIKSSIYRAPLRWSLRETWAKNISWPGYNMKRVFLTGVAPSGQSTNLLNYEHSKYDDILQGDFEDTYKSVSKKIYTGMRFVKLHCPSVKWILVADDDAVMLPWNVLTYFLDSSNVISDQKVVDENQKILAGFDITGARTIRDKKK